MVKKLMLIFIVGSFLPSVDATLMRLDFSGTIVGSYPFDGGSPIGQFSGYYVLDTAVPDSDNSDTSGRYNGAFVMGFVDWNGLMLDLSTSDTIVVTKNDSAAFSDLFALATFGLGVDGDPAFFFQLGDSSSTAFSDDSFPTVLNLADFDPFEIDNDNSTGVFAIVDGRSLQGSIDFVSYTAVPLPGALLLFCSGLFGMVTCARRRSKSVGLGLLS